MEPARRQPTRMSTSTSSSGNSSNNPIHSPRDIREKVHRFRVLIIGRANAGKTSILKKLCYETENPAICDATGHPVNLAALDPSDERGLHDINYAMIFRSNPGFVFHDSRGFEAGANDELKKVRGFLDRRSHTMNLQDRVHAIWYCIPLDDARPIQKPEIEFFEKCGTGDIPVIAVFTKLDSLDDKAFGCILDENDELDQETALSRVPEYSQRLFDELVPKLRISRAMYPPRSYVGLRDMHLPESTCLSLLEHTGTALDDETLHLMFVSVQRSILSMCTRLAFEKLLTETRNFDKNKHLTVKEAQKAILWYYPHLIVNTPSPVEGFELTTLDSGGI